MGNITLEPGNLTTLASPIHGTATSAGWLDYGRSIHTRVEHLLCNHLNY